MAIFSERKKFPSNMVKEEDTWKYKGGVAYNCSVLLDLAALDDLTGFRCEVEENGCDVNESSFWYGRRFGSKKMGLDERTPLMIAAMYGSTNVLKYIIETGKVDVNKACGIDRVTALHCTAAGGSEFSPEIVKLLRDASADVNCVDANGKKAGDCIAPAVKRVFSTRAKRLENLLKFADSDDDEAVYREEVQEQTMTPRSSGAEKKEYPIDITMPDINEGLYGTDEFRMYSFKIKPCSRAYSHDWTECPFVHPGENARRRDPRKYPYTCVPCPEFRKGACRQGDGCDYAHGVFESWLHPAQYRTRLCKDEIGCNRKVCFFAHKHEELRPLYASTGSGMPSPMSLSGNQLDMTTLSSSAMLLPPVSTPPMSPSTVSSSPNGGNPWQNKISLTPPALQLPGSRLKATLSARDLDMEMTLLGLETRHRHHQQQQHLMNEISNLSSPSYWNNDFSRIGELKPTNLDDLYQSQSPTGLQQRQNMNQLRSSYPNNLSLSPVRNQSPPYGHDSHGAVANAVMNSSRSSAFAKRSQSFIDRGVVHPHRGFTSAANSTNMMSSNLSNWNSPDGKLDWGIQGEELNKLRKSSSFGFRSNDFMTTTASSLPGSLDEPDVSWVNSLVKDVPSVDSNMFGGSERGPHHRSDGVHDVLPPWLEQMYMDQEQTVA